MARVVGHCSKEGGEDSGFKVQYGVGCEILSARAPLETCAAWSDSGLGFSNSSLGLGCRGVFWKRCHSTSAIGSTCRVIWSGFCNWGLGCIQAHDLKAFIQGLPRVHQGLIDSGRGITRADDAHGTPTQSHTSPNILVSEDENMFGPFAVSPESMTASFRVQGSGCRVQGSGCRVQGVGFRVQGSGFRGTRRWLFRPRT